MLFVVIAIACSVAAALVARRGDPQTQPSLSARAMGFLLAAAISAVWAAAAGDFANFEWPLLLLGLASGTAFAVAQYLCWRMVDSGQLTISPALLTAAMVAPGLAGLVLFNETSDLATLGGLGAAAVGIVLLGAGAPRVRGEGAGGSRTGWTALLFVVYALQFFALQFFSGVFLGKGSALFLLFTCGAAALGLGGMSLVRGERLERRDLLVGVELGVLRFAMLMCLLLAMNLLPSSVVFALVAVGHVTLVLLLERLIFARTLRAWSYAGLALAAAAVGVMLSSMF
jgi:multidrug transporter EmrE-like cation transporter